jgi:hypothetical protein
MKAKRFIFILCFYLTAMYFPAINAYENILSPVKSAVEVTADRVAVIMDFNNAAGFADDSLDVGEEDAQNVSGQVGYDLIASAARVSSTEYTLTLVSAANFAGALRDAIIDVTLTYSPDTYACTITLPAGRANLKSVDLSDFFPSASTDVVNLLLGTPLDFCTVVVLT